MTAANAINTSVRIGIDLGGTKIAGIVLGAGDATLAEQRVAAPRGNYDRTIEAIRDLSRALAATSGSPAGLQVSTGIGMPGSISPRTGLVQNANSTWLNGRAFKADLEAALGQPVLLDNDANCFALSEAADGAAAGARSVFGVILGTGCGGGLVHRGRLIDGPHGIGGEWGHNPLPWMTADEFPGPTCWCGRAGCLETVVSGTGLAADHVRVTGQALASEEIVAQALAGGAAAKATLDRHADRLARGLAHVVNLFDPEVIVLGGGLSALTHLYEVLPGQVARHVLSDAPAIDIRPPRWGDASGVRGAARLWDGA
jgi:fructokinase